MRSHIRIGACVVLALACVGIWYAIWVYTPSDSLRVSFLDVGQGDAIFIEAPSGNHMLIDGGADVRIARLLDAHLSPFDRSIDVVVATHPDADHIGGLATVFDRFAVGMVVRTGAEKETAAYASFEAAIAEEGAKQVTARRGTRIALGPHTTFHVLFPDRDMDGVDINTASVIGKLEYKETSFLLTGDAPRAVETYITRLDSDTLAADVLKVGHHGSDTSTTKELLGYTSPEYAIISAGVDNSYGHPHQSVLDLLSLFGIQTLGTYKQGTITFKSDGKEITIISE